MSKSRSRPTWSLLGALMPVMALLACADPQPQAPPAEPPAERLGTPSSGTGISDWSRVLAEVDSRLATARQISEQSPDSWLKHQQVAELWQERARLTGDYSDLLAAQERMARAFAVAREGSGPFLARARLDYSLHRLAAVEGDLQQLEQRIMLDDRTQAAIALLRAKLAFQQGDYPAARSGLATASTLSDGLQLHSAHGLLAWRTGDFTAAEEHYTAAESRIVGTAPEARAWIHLQRGLMDLDRGRWDEALAHYRDADAQLPGYWLIDEHIAEILVLRGETAQAREIYQRVVEQTKSPELMGALAELLQEQGHEAEATALITQAGQGWAQRLEQLPEAAIGHALEHQLAHGDPQTALALAQQNRDLRPGAPARILLAQAYLAVDQVEAAEQEIAWVLQSPWRSAELYLVAAEIAAAAGDPQRAREHHAAARAINPQLPEVPSPVEEAAAP